MELATLSDRYGGFYAPAFTLRVGGRDLVRTELVAVSQVEADLLLGAAARFSFTVVDSYSLADHAFLSGTGKNVLDLLAFGTEVQVYMGYGDATGMPLMMTGVITEISTSFPEAGTPELAIAGYDKSFPLTNGKSARTWTNARDSDAVNEIASFHNLGALVEQTAEQHPQIEQNQESDFEFIKKLAERNHYELYVDADSTLHFARPNDKGGAVVTLAWGRGLLSFKPEANLAGQVRAVEVYGWDPQRKEKIVGRARAGEESGYEPQRRSAGDRLGALVRDISKQPVLRLRQPVFTQAEANSRAQAALNERAKQFLTGDAETVGLPEIRRHFPTVDAVRKLAKVNINDASNCMREWRRTHAVQNEAPQLQVPEALQLTCTSAFQVLWKEAVNLSSETLRMAQAGWEAERADGEAMNEQIARACAAQEEELLAAKSAIEMQAEEIMRLNELLTASQHRAGVAERSVVELRTAVSHLEATSVEIGRRADDLRQALDQAHASYAAILREKTATLNAQVGDITSLRRELEAVRQQSESSSTTARSELLAAIEEAAALRGKLDALSRAHVRNPK